MHEKEFLKLLHNEEGRLLRIAWAMLGQESDAWDVLQEAVEQAWRHRRELKGGAAAFPSWIRQIVVNRALNMLRNKKRLILLEPEMLSKHESAASPETDVEAQLIWDEVAELDQGQRQIITLRYLADLTLQDIAAELDLPLGTVKSRLHRALANLRIKWDGRVLP